MGTYTNVDYKDVTLQLEVVPLINSDNEVTLDILQKIDSVVAGQSTQVNGTNVPTIATRYLKSTVSAPNNSTIVLGGLITQDNSTTTNDIPYLSKIPLLGNLFKSHTRTGDRNELIILMHPEVINTDQAAKRPAAEGRRPHLPRPRPRNPTPAAGSAQGHPRIRDARADAAPRRVTPK